ncbi:hypothetical protein ACS0TY_001583 [Phlomoides rotata]
MGCSSSSSSKLHDLPAVALCRERCAFLDEAIRHRFAFADAHAAYLLSLNALALSLHPPFFNPNKIHSDSSHSGSILHGNSPHQSDYGNPNFMNMKSQTTPSLMHTQRPITPETTMPIADSSSYPYPNYNDFNGYSNYAAGGGFFGGDSTSLSPVVAKVAPPPPEGSTWDFLNPFDKYYPVYTPINDSREVREEEGIPDLEDDDEDEVHVDHGGSSTNSNPEENEKVNNDAELVHKKNAAVAAEEEEEEKSKAAEFKPRGGFKDDLEVVKEIQLQFQRASESGNDVAKFLEVGKIQYKRKYSSLKNHVTSKILHLPMVSTTSDSADPDIHQDVELMSKNLSSILHKLHLWERKLYQQVKVEEKMRLVHERKSQKLKRMDERGWEGHKVDATRSLVRSLSTKIKMGIQVVDNISVKINRLRDEELWPQLNELIQGLRRMWKSMVECHGYQCEAMGEAKGFDGIALSDEGGRDLINWTLCFSHWVDAQKGYVRALTNWLLKCLLYVPEQTVDGTAPFSPGRMGAPAVFVVCHQWAQELDRLSGKEVVNSMRDLASNVVQQWEQDQGKIKNQQGKEEQKMHKALLDKRRVMYHSEMTTKGGSLQASLQHVLEAMGHFTANSLKIYENLLQRIEDDRPSCHSA